MGITLMNPDPPKYPIKNKQTNHKTKQKIQKSNLSKKDFYNENSI